MLTIKYSAVKLSNYDVTLSSSAAGESYLNWKKRGLIPKMAKVQTYLSEICYRYNRRFWEKELFDRLVKACISTQTITHSDLVRGHQSIHRY